jgi:Lon-like protease
VAAFDGRRALVLLALVAAVWASQQIRLDYVSLAPGPAVDVASMIQVEDGRAAPRDSLFLTTVYSDMDITALKWVQAQLSGDTLLLPRRTVLPHSMDVSEYVRLVSDMMEESKTVSKVAALRHLGHDVTASGEGASVQELLPGSTAADILRPGDIIVEAEGQRVTTATDLVNTVRRQQPGSTVSLVVRRGPEEFETRVGTRESDTEPGIAVMGVMVRTHQFGHNLPVGIEIDSQNIGGTSAGLMFALGIIDALEEGNLTAGRRVAGTGTISLDGTVGPVGGVAQKVIGAERSGAQYFLVPRDIRLEAERAAPTIQVVPVDNLEDAVLFLKQLSLGSTLPVTLPHAQFTPRYRLTPAA